MEIRSFDSSTRSAGAIIKSGRELKFENKHANAENSRGSSVYDEMLEKGQNSRAPSAFQVMPKSKSSSKNHYNDDYNNYHNNNNNNNEDIDEIDVTSYNTSLKRNSLRPNTPSTFLIGSQTNHKRQQRLNSNKTPESVKSHTTDKQSESKPDDDFHNETNVNLDEEEKHFARIEITPENFQAHNPQQYYTNEEYFELDYFKLLKSNSLDFIQSPPPKGYQIRAKLVVNKGIFNEYSFFIEDANNKDFLLMSTCRKKTSPTLCYFINAIDTNSRNNKNNEVKFGRLNANLSRSNYSLIGNLDEADGNENEDTSRPKSSLKKGQNSTMRYFDLEYNYKLIGYSKPKELVVDLLMIDQINEHQIDEDQVKTMFNRISSKKVLVTKKPEYDQKTKKFKLDFKGRALLASSNNLQIIDEAKPNNILFQMGKLQTKIYNCDYAYPVNAFQAFGIAVSCISRN